MYYLLITANPQQILEWHLSRQQLENKPRSPQTTDIIALEQNILKTTLISIAKITGSGIIVVKNNPESTTDNIQQLSDFFKDL